MTTPTREINQYLADIDTKYRQGNAKEHSYRPALQNLFEAITTGLSITNEPARIDCGAPDYIVTRAGVPVGYIEAKDIPAGIHDKAHKAQFDRYKNALGNLIITDYINFELFIGGELRMSAAIGQMSEKGIAAHKGQFADFAALIDCFISYEGKTITDSEQLAKMMAQKARLLSVTIKDALHASNADEDSLSEQLQGFQKILIHDLSAETFADMYAQTLAYGMFAARLNDKTSAKFSRRSAADLIPQSNPFLLNFFDYIGGIKLDKRITWIVDALADMFNCVSLEDLLREFGKANQDPFIHFYETFLGEYDPKLRKSRGVYYTPTAVVRFIVQAADDALIRDFGISQGLADNSKVLVPVMQKDGTKKETPVHKVQILDPATGTGTFLAEVIDRIYSKFAGQKGLWSSYCGEQLIPRLNGFEILMASYTMAHFKLAMKLKETGYSGNFDERLRVFLTNTLEEPKDDAPQFFMEKWLTDEAKAANIIKRDTPVMVVLGNPPYSGESENQTAEAFLQAYKKEPGGIDKLDEKNSKWLNDDYVKFIRFGQLLVEKNETGVLAFINNHSFLDNPTFRGMRWDLLRAFDTIYILDLHGNSKKKETAPDGGKDENVFDIQQGVSINIFIKTGKKKDGELARALHFDLYGKRELKRQFLSENTLASVKWQEIKPQAPYYFLVSKNLSGQAEYEKGFSIKELFPVNSVGTVTANDSVFVNDNKVLLAKNIKDFLGINPDEKLICNINYRPFDNQYIYYDTKKIARAREKVMQHFIVDENVGLVTVNRQPLQNPTTYYFIANNIISNGYIRSDSVSIDTIFPLYLYDQDNYNDPVTNRRPNLDTRIVDAIADKIGLRFVPEKETLVERLLNAPNIALDGEAYRGKYEVDKTPKENAASISAYLKQMAKTTRLENSSIREPIKLGGSGITKLTMYGMSNIAYMKTIAHIPELLGNAILLLKKLPEKPDSHYQKYCYLLSFFEIDGVEWTARIVLGENEGCWYYQHIISEIKKRSLIDVILETNVGHQQTSLPINDTKLLKILQGLFEKNNEFPAVFAPIDLLDYIYAMLHSPTYREKYREFLKIDFPRVPYPGNAGRFLRLARLGETLRKIHLLEGVEPSHEMGLFPVDGSREVEKAEYKDGQIWINKTQYFDTVPPEVWDFYIGGYQPAQKWLKDRKGRVLDYDGIQHYQRILAALRLTGELMAQVDGAAGVRR
ncbi:type ISP restriction/modification enzyme [Treponema endosymbiont of Eucomonympha sp.]|uniref:type ISP restriction/modification enzyme n=1 Tax=Treponema endosymbiont of Eucomonympha sp. TaxID=1580831 RepID=UPI00075168EF|nr:type ISP restriction/modification enzyme [Treponema endosymbiont of Eucomonympha sp.]